MSARVLVEASLLDPSLVRKLRPGAELTDEDVMRAVRSSLAALAAWGCGVLSAESRAGQYKHLDVERAAAHLHGMIDAQAAEGAPA
jgi:hypothetical protein